MELACEQYGAPSYLVGYFKKCERKGGWGGKLKFRQDDPPFELESV